MSPKSNFRVVVVEIVVVFLTSQTFKLKDFFNFRVTPYVEYFAGAIDISAPVSMGIGIVSSFTFAATKNRLLGGVFLETAATVFHFLISCHFSSPMLAPCSAGSPD